MNMTLQQLIDELIRLRDMVGIHPGTPVDIYDTDEPVREVAVLPGRVVLK